MEKKWKKIRKLKSKAMKIGTEKSEDIDIWYIVSQGEGH